MFAGQACIFDCGVFNKRLFFVCTCDTGNHVIGLPALDLASSAACKGDINSEVGDADFDLEELTMWLSLRARKGDLRSAVWSRDEDELGGNEFWKLYLTVA